jgi:thiol-disulfide isomerase/thioredoxin
VGAGALVALVIGVVIAISGGSDSRQPADGETPFGPITVSGAALPALASTTEDPAVGQAAPKIDGTTPTGAAATVGGAGQPTMIVFLAHWCPHCQRELPLVVELMRSGDLDGVRMVAIATGTSADRPNYPPVPWLEREHWSGDTILDDEASSAAQAYGLSGYPFLVFLDADGKLVARASGELPAEDIVALADQIR